MFSIYTHHTRSDVFHIPYHNLSHRLNTQPHRILRFSIPRLKTHLSQETKQILNPTVLEYKAICFYNASSNNTRPTPPDGHHPGSPTGGLHRRLQRHAPVQPALAAARALPQRPDHVDEHLPHASDAVLYVADPSWIDNTYRFRSTEIHHQKRQ